MMLPMDKRIAKQHMSDVRALLLEWDAIGVADEPSCQDEYDCMIGPLLSHLRGGSDAVFIRDWIARERIDHFGLNKDNGRDRALADKLVLWWSQQTIREN
jgi:hypothetical protein